MRHSINRRTLVQSVAALVAAGVLPASWAQAAKIGLIFSETMTDQDVRAKLLVEKYGPALGPDFDF